jgi:hypothetical protein
MQNHELANNLIHRQDAQYVGVGTFGSIEVGKEKNYIGSNGFGACHAVVIKVGSHIAVGHIMTMTQGLHDSIRRWARFAARDKGRAWIWVPQTGGLDENVLMVRDLQNALAGVQVTKVTRERSQTVPSVANIVRTAMCVSNYDIIFGDYREKF